MQHVESKGPTARKRLLEQEIKQEESGRTLDSAAMAEKLLKLVDEVGIMRPCAYMYL